jgi:hypothetical protein
MCSDQVYAAETSCGAIRRTDNKSSPPSRNPGISDFIRKRWPLSSILSRIYLIHNVGNLMQNNHKVARKFCEHH